MKAISHLTRLGSASAAGVLVLAGCAEASSSSGSAGGGAGGGGGVEAASGGIGGSAASGNPSGGTPTGGSAATGGNSTGGAGNPTGGAGGAGSVRCGGTGIPMGTGGPSGGPVGTWTDVTPSSVDLSLQYGAQDVVVDPARPSDFYAFICLQGVYKSTDYGQTWKHVSTGTMATQLESGRPWGAGIDSNRCRDPNTPPTLYTFSGYGAQGFWKSTDGGVNWSMKNLPNDKTRPNDGYDVDVDPYDGKHLIVAFHEETGLAESTDGGETWTSVPLASGMASGISWYPFFIDTGDPASTRKTWINIAQQNAGESGTWRTSDGGNSWTQVDKTEHLHGGSQIFQDQGAVYMAGAYSVLGWGVLRSTTQGATWTHVGSGGVQSVVYGTPNSVYSQPASDQSQAERAPQPGTSWSAWPLSLSAGPKRVAVSYDGAHYVFVSGNWQTGIWRYVEP